MVCSLQAEDLQFLSQEGFCGKQVLYRCIHLKEYYLSSPHQVPHPQMLPPEQTRKVQDDSYVPRVCYTTGTVHLP